MDYTIEFPKAGTKEQNIKDLIINYLAVEWPLTSKRIFSVLKKKYNVSVTYQAVFKALKELTEREILTKDKKEYSINLGWVDQLGEFSKEVKETYFGRSSSIKREVIEEGKMQHLIFENLFDLDKFLMSQIQKFLCSEEFKNLKCYSYWQFDWWPLFISRDEYKTLLKVKNPKRLDIVIKDSSKVAELCAKMYKKFGAKALTGVDLGKDFDFIILGDYILQIYNSPKALKKINYLFSKIKKIDELNFDELIKIFCEKEEISVIVMKNQNIAKILSEEVMSCFSR